MAKRIYQVAKTIGAKGVDLVHYLRDQGFDVKSHMSPCSDEMIESLGKKYPEFGKASKPAKKATKKVAKKASKKTAKKVAKKVSKVAASEEEEAAVALEEVSEEPKAEEKETQKPTEKTEPEEKSGESSKEESTPEVEEKKDKPRVIRYAPGFGPGSRSQRPQRPAAESSGGQEKRQGQDLLTGFKFKSQGGRGGPGVRGNVSSARGTAGAFGSGPSRRKKRKKRGTSGLAEQEIAKSVRQAMADTGGKTRKRRKGSEGEEGEEVLEANTPLKVLPLSTLFELAQAMDVPETDVIASCLQNGMMVTINQRLEKEDIELIAAEYSFDVEFLSEYGEEKAEEVVEVDESDLSSRPPIVTVMGHVDHGKTKLLDYIRKANVVAREAGAITQHIGAYSVKLPGGSVTFLDTPGHEAFSAMRARGTSVTDIVILVVAANDSVMPQTVEAIDHAKAAGVPIIVAVNKIDLPDANPDRVKQDLLQHGITVEDFGGDIPAVPISAKQGIDVDKLLEIVLLQAEMLELKGAPSLSVKGTVVEAKKDPGRGVLFTVLVQQGTLNVGDFFAVGQHFGAVRAMVNEWGDKVTSVGPGMPVEVMGSGGVPEPGDSFMELDTEQEAREISLKRQQLKREQEIRYKRLLTLDQLYTQIQQGEVHELKLVLKGDVGGSVEAMADSLQKLSTEEVKVVVVHKSVGTINESDVLLAAASNAIVIGFHVRPQSQARDLAKREGVDVRTYDIIYEAVDAVRNAMEGMLTPDQVENVTGMAEVRELFRVPKIGVIAGCLVKEGTVERNNQIRIIRDGIVIGTRRISSLKRFKEDVRSVESGFECGIGLVDFQDLKVGDQLESFLTEEVARKL
ncbi:MAG: translation initiation factor IF-2 [Candidatus Krumholzibacteria bacterium]|nr:translation initiation factor IF-2 [Candidatus Krumholzibacteria bacterium]